MQRPQVSPHYDSLLAKMMVWAPTRAEAAAKMAAALAKTELQVRCACVRVHVRMCGRVVMAPVCALVCARVSAAAAPARWGPPRPHFCVSSSPLRAGRRASRCLLHLPAPSTRPASSAATPQGVPNNVEFLRAVVADARFLAGDTTTRFLEGFHFTPHVAEVLAPGEQQQLVLLALKLFRVGLRRAAEVAAFGS